VIWLIQPKEKGMNQHVKETKDVLDVDDKPVRDDTVFVQDDGDYPVDPLDSPGADAPEVKED